MENAEYLEKIAQLILNRLNHKSNVFWLELNLNHKTTNFLLSNAHKLKEYHLVTDKG